MNAVIYLRYSSHSQNEQSIETQRDTCTIFAKRNNLEIINEYIDEAKTGTTDKRESFQRMIEDSNKKAFQYIITYKVDRFARDKYDSAIYKKQLKKLGIKVLSASENIDDSEEGEMMEGILETLAHYYSRNLSRNIKDGMYTNAKKGLSIGGMTLPLGLKSVKETREIVIDKETAPIVKKIFEMAKEKTNYADIIRYLNLHKLKTSRKNEFNKNSIKRLLSNEKYIGIYRFRGEIVSTNIPQIIDEELFNDVQDILKKRVKNPSRTRAKNEYLLTGKLFCGKCEDMMTGQSSTSKTKRLYHYYTCRTRIADKSCNKERVSKELIEDYAVMKARELLTKDRIDEITKNIMNYVNKVKDTSEIKRLEKELKDSEQQKHSLLDSLKLCPNDSIKKSIFDEYSKMEEHEKELKSALIIEKAHSIKISSKDIKLFLNSLRNGKVTDIQYKRMMIDVFIYRLYLYDDDKIMMAFTIQNDMVECKLPSSKELLSAFQSQSAPPL